MKNLILILVVSFFGTVFGAPFTAPAFAQTATSQDLYQLVRDEWIQNFNYMNTFLLIEAAADWAHDDATTTKLVQKAHDNNKIDKFIPLSKSPPIQISKKDETFVTELRASAQMMRAIYYFMDRRHKPDSQLNEFTIALGDFKDALIGEQKRKKASLRLLEILSKINLRQAISEFQPTDPTDSQAFMKLKLEELQERVTAAKNLQIESGLAEGDYHEIRKLFRDFSNLLILETFLEPNPKVDKILARLDPLVAVMGKSRDKIIQNTMGDKKKRRAATLDLPESVQKMTLDLSSLLLGRNAASAKLPITSKCGFIFR